MWLSFRRTHHDYQNPLRRLLLANHGGRLPRLRQKMHTMPEAWQPYTPETRAASLYTIPVAFHKVWNRHPRPFLPRQRSSKVLNSSRRLLHQVDRDQTLSHHYCPASPIIRLEGYYMSVWHPTYNHHRHWPTFYKQRTR